MVNIMSKITFKKYGIDIHEENYRGDIGNHRIRAEVEQNGIKFYIEIQSTYTRQTKHKTTGKELKHHKTFYNNNGMLVHIWTHENRVERTCAGTYAIFETQRDILNKWKFEERFNDKSYHTKMLALAIINGELKTDFKEMEIV